MATGRLNLVLGDEYMDLLDNFVEKVHQTRTQVIRDAITMYINNYQKKPTKARINTYAGLFQEYGLKSVDGLVFQRELRKEWV